MPRISAATGGLLAALIALAGAAVAQEPPTASERFEALVERINDVRAGLRTLEAGFVQRKQSELLLEPEESRGRFSYQAPDRVRWDFTSPADTVVVVRGQEMTTWYRDQGRVERIDLGRQGDRILHLLGPSASLDSLRRYFSLTVTFPSEDGAPYRLRLDPRLARVRKRIESMTLAIDRELLVPVEIHFAEAGGDTTELVFHDLRINQEIPPGHFEPELPDDAGARR